MHKDRTIGQLICQKHADQLPTPWYKLNLVLEDETSEMNALIIGKSGEKLLGTTCRHLVRVYSHTLGAISKVYRGKAFSKTLHMQYSLTWNLLDFRLSESCDFVIIFHGISFVLVSSLSISLLNCMDDKRKYKGMHLAPTFEVPPMSRHPKTGDCNKKTTQLHREVHSSLLLLNVPHCSDPWQQEFPAQNFLKV